MAHIKLNSVDLEFPIYGNNSRSLKQRVLNFSSGGAIKKFDSVTTVKALDNLSIELKDGDKIGLIGHNGSGKSTLLRLLAGIYEPIIGSIEVQGSIASLIDFTMGLMPELTGIENIKLMGKLKGLNKDEVSNNIQSIVEFTELGDFIYLPIRSYSSGMQLRLAFALATQYHFEIFLIDEVVGVGDVSFQEQAKKRINNIVDKSNIVVLASHDDNILKQICNKILWLDKGKIVFSGSPDEALEKYNKKHGHF
ncbi:MAG: ABC transporter ATP-binding protein [Legionellales bacterium]|nr:ABC transporter ATP-binding protein [Legionellales bacterium]